MEDNVKIQDDSIIQNSQITATTHDSQRVEGVKRKDPRKVAAGKALAEKNVKRRAEKKIKVKESSLIEMSTIFDGIQKSAVLVGSGFTLYYGYNFLKNLYSRRSDTGELTAPTMQVEEVITQSPLRRYNESNDLDF